MEGEKRPKAVPKMGIALWRHLSDGALDGGTRQDAVLDLWRQVWLEFSVAHSDKLRHVVHLGR